MLIKTRPYSMDIVKQSLTPKAKCSVVDILNKTQRKGLLVWEQDEKEYHVTAKPDVLYYVIYNLVKYYDIELM